MNPVPLLYWAVAGGVLGLAPRLLLGWSWWASLVAGLAAVPPVTWLAATLLDRWETASPEKPPPPLVLGPPVPCPRCGADGSAEILYGLPAMTGELETALADGRVVLAGCLVYAGAPRWNCRRCGEKHGRIALGTAVR